MAQLVKNPLAMEETWVGSLGWEDPLEKGMATHSSILTWRFPWTVEPGGLQPWGRRVRHDKATDQHHDHNQLTIISSLTALSDPLLENAGTVLQGICSLRQIRWDFPSSSVDKNLPASAGARARSLVQEDSTCCRATKPVRHKY